MKTVKQTAEIFGVHPETIRRWIKSKRLNATQIDKNMSVRIDEEEIERLKKGK